MTIKYVERSQRLAHGARTARELEQYSTQESLRASVKFERPAFNRPAFEAAAVGVFAAFAYALVSVALTGSF